MRIGLVGSNSIEYIEQLFKIWNQGNSALLIDWRTPPTAIIERLNEAGASVCLMESAYYKNNMTCYASRTDIQFVEYTIKHTLPCLLPPEIRYLYRGYTDDSEALVVYSSGTTGRAKGIIHTHGNLLKNAKMIADYMKLSNCDCMYMMKNIFHLSSITGELLASIASGSELLISPIIVLPRQILSNINHFHVTRVCLNPYLLKLLIEEQEKHFHELNFPLEVYVYGEKTSEQLLNRATVLSEKVYCEYGLSEAGPRVASQKNGMTSVVSAGMPLKGVSIKIMTADNVEANIGEIGSIWVKTPCRFCGYIIGNKDYLSIRGDYLVTGDIGYVNDKGELFVIGREDDMININAHKIYPSEIETIIIAEFNVEECKVVSVQTIDGRNELCCIYSGRDIPNSEIQVRLKTSLIDYEIPKFFGRCDCLPRLSSGKVDMYQVKQLAKFIVK